MFGNLRFDLNYAWRLLLKTPGNSLLCVAVVALSVGLSLFVYVVDYNIALKPLPFAGSQRWLSVQVAQDAATLRRPAVDAYTYQELVQHSRSVDQVGAFAAQAAVLSEGQRSVRLRAAAISPELLGATGAVPLMGRLFTADDGRSGAARTVILSYDTWQNNFAGDATIVGKQTRIDGNPVHILAVMPQDFFAFRDFELWFPLQLPALAQPRESGLVLSPFVTLRDGQTAAAALSELQSVVDDVGKRFPDVYGGERVAGLFPAHRMYTHGKIAVISMATLIAIAVLVLGGVNISMIFFAMLLERSRELALRKALGSTRNRLLRQCLLQSVFVVCFGLLAGVGLAAMGVRWAHGLLDFSARLMSTGRDPNELVMRPWDLGAAVAAAIALWLFTTLIPAWRLAKLDAAATLAGSGKGVGGGSNNKLAAVLVGLQVVVACTLLVVCANVVVSVNKELRRPIGIAVEHRVISTYPTEFDARYEDPAKRLAYWDELENAIVRRLPGAAVAFATATPTAPDESPAAIENGADPSRGGALNLPIAVVSEKYFDVLGIERRSGRLFDATDARGSMDVAVVDENTARRFWPDRDPVGQRIRLDPAGNGPWLTIVGVVSSVAAPYGGTDGVVYRPLRQAVPGAFQLIVTAPATAGEPQQALLAAAYDVNPDLPLHNVQRLDEYMVAINGFRSLVPGFTGIGLITLLLAASGLFGLISRSVSQRVQEIGILRALGSTKSRVLGMFLRQAAIYLAIGAVGGGVGILLSTAMSAAIPNVLDHVFAVSALVLVMIAVVILVSSYVPARRAVTLEPGDALRYE